MFLSVFDIFKIGIGPSSSHTMGPMLAAARFLDDLRGGAEKTPGAGELHRLGARLYGSLAWTGKGHATDRAVILGLCGLLPETLDPAEAEALEAQVRRERIVRPEGLGELRFDPERDLVFDFGPPLEGHANGMVLKAYDRAGNGYHTQTYYSVGGGFVVTAAELAARDEAPGPQPDATGPAFPYPFTTAREMLAMAARSGKSIAAMKRANETVLHGDRLDTRIDAILAAMDSCIERGLSQDGILPGGLQVRRRAKAIHDQLLAEEGRNLAQPHQANDWMSVYAMAVNEENAAGGKVVTSPTNGAAGVVPAVLRYYRDHCIGATTDGARDLLLVAAAIGGLIKHNASISGAEVGCQGEVGSASAMGAAGLCAALGGSDAQVENAAEIALEHHLGMTCDPAAGLVQVPCIERNALGAIKAVSAASIALRGDGTHFMPLDNCIRVMRETGRDMDVKYKETSQGGIAVNLPEC
ncbi:L-serine dehydratase, iron-sulfur-dependent, single chain form [Oceanicola granulosus HTCC2516]|uniref:L-serine dehydratase n=1 Tax=Oceanicola granulosus (strain ATCC BAA-861 / DSM 15982 / KCTC 12143 / HTCC2516) TaxID=314256 RepID=Q2CH38_OCEGH|nr:L-serine ammonia-lyase [Oceanicola granulosus]EAR51973.1 L-serine dehydratase, iron-sulfur-dependent, single chain form [Oceanicola granulosus HTCC2516]